MIADKDGNDVNFVLNDTQRKLDDGRCGRDIVPKARQEGVSAYILAYFLVECLSKRNTRAVVISHDLESTKRLLARVHYYLDNMRGPKAETKVSSKNEISFPVMNSVFYLGTAGGRIFGRGDTITHLHCSEYAYWPDPKNLMIGLQSAVPASGQIFIESTGNGFNDYHKRCMRAQRGRSAWKVHFFSWIDFPDYQIPLASDEKEYLRSHLNPEWEEDILFAEGVSLEQIAWRRIIISDNDDDVDAFKQEYPRFLDECFQMSSKSIFRKVNYEQSKEWTEVDRGEYVLKPHPSQSKRYLIGVDVAGGVGQDYSVIEVLDLATLEQVYEFCSNLIDPEMLAYEVVRVAKEFNMAYTTVEANNHGILTLSILEKIYPRELIHQDEYAMATDEERSLHSLGYRTTARNKPLMIGRLRVLLKGEMTIHSEVLKAELSTFVEDSDTKRLGAQAGCYDDTVMAMACCITGINPASLLIPIEEPEDTDVLADPFSLDSIINELSSSQTPFPIRPQHANANQVLL